MRALLFFLSAAAGSAQVGQTETECEKKFGAIIHRMKVMDDERLTSILFRPINREAPGVICVFDEDRRCIAVSYMLDAVVSTAFLNVALDHNGGRAEWTVAKFHRGVLAVRNDRKFIAYQAASAATPWLTIASQLLLWRPAPPPGGARLLWLWRQPSHAHLRWVRSPSPVPDYASGRRPRMKLIVEIDHQRLAVIRGAAGFRSQSLGEYLARMVDTHLEAELEGLSRQFTAYRRENERPPPLRVRVSR